MTIDFWYSIGSTYSFLTVMRIGKVAEATGINFVWRPFNVREIMREMGNVPFADKPVKASYMWRDIARRADMYGLKANVPAPYPIVELELANRVAIVARNGGWCPAYTRATYRRWFEDGEMPGSEPNLSASIEEAGQDPSVVLVRANSGEGERGLEEATEEARQIGIFGSPSFVVDGELFWGDDRLNDAIAWYRTTV